MKSELITCFQDTLKFSEEKLKDSTITSINSNKIYKEKFLSKVARKDENAIISVHSGTSFDMAKKYCEYGKVAVLNFANPQNPGGGVCNGAMAQEECLCRSSNLYACISNENVFNEYYGYHREIQNFFFSDRLIYTKDVIVFKNDDEVPCLLPEKEWFNVDVITCAAPFLGKRKYTNKKALKELFKGRIRNIFEASIDNAVDVLILGAFGCGAFKNPPEIVAEAFYEVIDENAYEKCFKQIVFAIKSTNNDNPFEPCPNIFAFESTFMCASMDSRLDMHIRTSEFGKLRWTDNYPLAQAVGSVELPSGRVLKGGKEFNPYFEWRDKNKYCGKQFSILGDSISTLNGYNPRGYKVFYYGDNCKKTNVREYTDTWWGEVLKFFGADLLVNNSWSGSRVTKLPNQEELFPSGCSDERTASLHIITVNPDVIIINLGTNDWIFGARTGDETSILDVVETELFEEAYRIMLRKIKSNYPESEVWCCTLSETFISDKPAFTFPHKYAGIHIEDYNDIIRRTVREYQCKLIDLYNMKKPYDSIDGSHPNKSGMKTIAASVCYEMSDEVGRNFLSTEKEESTLLYDIYLSYGDFPIHNVTISCGSNIIYNNAINAVRDGDLIYPEKFFDKKEISLDITQKSRLNSIIRDLELDDAQYYQGSHSGDCFQYSTYDDLWYDIKNPEKLVAFCEELCDFIPYETKSEFEQSLSVARYNSDGADREESVANNLIGTSIEERYIVLELIHEDPVTKIYLVKDKRLNKYWSMSYYNKVENSNFDMVYQSIMSEVKLVMKLDHPMIPRIVDIIENSWATFIVREYVEGNDLESIVKAQGPQAIDKVIDWGKQLCDVLTYLHTLSQPHIHRDIKPANIILMPDGRIKLIDFGIMRLYHPSKLADTCCLGTKGYAAPEQFGGRQTDARTDIYGLGMTLHHLITGIDPKLPPYETKPIRQVNPSLPVGLEYIISKCVEFNSDDRYQNCVELKKDLDNYLNISPNKRSGILTKLFKR